MQTKKTYSLDNKTLKLLEDYHKKTRIPRSVIVDEAIKKYIDNN